MLQLEVSETFILTKSKIIHSHISHINKANLRIKSRSLEINFIAFYRIVFFSSFYRRMQVSQRVTTKLTTCIPIRNLQRNFHYSSPILMLALLDAGSTEQTKQPSQTPMVSQLLSAIPPKVGVNIGENPLGKTQNY